MKPTTFTQEILLIAGTSFSRQELCTRTSTPCGYSNPSYIDELANACWAGLICELLPELAPVLTGRCHMFIWSVITSKQCLIVNQGTAPFPVNKETSVDPHLLLSAIQLN